MAPHDGHLVEVPTVAPVEVPEVVGGSVAPGLPLVPRLTLRVVLESATGQPGVGH